MYRNNTLWSAGVDLLLQAPSYYTDCRKIRDIDVWYRLSSESQSTKNDYSSTDTTATLTNIDPGEYVVQVIMANGGDISTYSEKTITVDYSKSLASRFTAGKMCCRLKQFKMLDYKTQP